MITNTLSIILLVSGSLFLILDHLALQSINVDAIKFEPVPFNKIPKAIINSHAGEYKFGADYSMDFGDETVIKNDPNAEYANNMTLDKNENESSLEFACDSNDICDTSLAPTMVKIYLADSDIQDQQIAENSIPTLELGENDCSSKSTAECSNFDFSIPRDIVPQKYKIVVDISFDEAEWIFINPVQIS